MPENIKQTATNTASHVLSTALFCMAIALGYFSYSILKVVDKLPEILTAINKTSSEITPLAAKIENLTTLVPSIITEVKEVRLQIPLILEETQKIRNTVSSIIAETQKIRSTLPPVVEEIAKVRGQIPPLVAELNAYQVLIPKLLVEIEETRGMVPTTLNRVEKIITQAGQAGTKASEGIASGFFSGVVKMPFSMIANLGSSIFSNKNLSKKDMSNITNLALNLVREGQDGQKVNWISEKTNISGTILLVGTHPPKKKWAHFNFKKCRTVKFIDVSNDNKSSEKIHMACQNPDGIWEWVEI